LAKAEGASITLVNIMPNSSRSLLRGFNADIRKFEEYMTAESSKKMKELTRLFDLSPEDIDCEVRFGNVRDEIIRMSKEGEYDVIVIGSKNPTITTHLLGSNAESILRYATIPVLVVR
ncbi:TPA: universal stress protein, partial [Enterobacter cloacae]